MSYSYTYITFMLIYYIIGYVIFSCTVIMYYSCTVIMYYFHILYSCTVSYTVFMYCSYTNFIYCFPVILFILLFSFMYYTCSNTFHVIDTLLLALVYLSYYHRIAVLCFSYHVMYFYPHAHILVIGFMFHACINLRSGYGN